MCLKPSITEMNYLSFYIRETTREYKCINYLHYIRRHFCVNFSVHLGENICIYCHDRVTTGPCQHRLQGWSRKTHMCAACMVLLDSNVTTVQTALIAHKLYTFILEFKMHLGFLNAPCISGCLWR